MFRPHFPSPERPQPILVAEDDKLVRTAVRGWLLEGGWEPLEAASPDEALLLAEDRSPGVAICDVDMGRGLDGIRMAAKLRQSIPEIAIIYATANTQVRALTTLGPGVTRCLLKPYGSSELLEMVGQASAQSDEYRRQKLVVTLVEQRLYLHRRIEELTVRRMQSAEPRDWVAASGHYSSPWLRTVARELLPDQDTDRQEELLDLALLAARRLELPDEHLEDLRVALALRGLGTLVIPHEVVGAARALAGCEREVLRHYPREARSAIALLGWRTAAVLVGMIRERWDGAGYPDGLQGQRVPLAARLLGAVDAMDAVMSPRPYRPSAAREDALAELRRCAGTQFDPAVIDALVG